MADEGFQRFQQTFADQPTQQQTQNGFANPAVSQTQQMLQQQQDASRAQAAPPIPGKKPKPDPNQAMEHYASQIQQRGAFGNVAQYVQDKATVNRMNDDQAVAPQLGVEKLQSAGTGVNPQTGETEALSIGTRANIGLTENTFNIFDDKVKKFKSTYNEQTGYKLADMKEVKDKDGDAAVMFTLDGAHWARVKPTFFEKLETFSQLTGKTAKNETDRYLERNVAWEILNDLADNPVDTIIAIAGGSASAGATGIRHAMRLTFPPAAIAKLAGAETEKLMGYGDPSSDGKVDFLESAWEGGKTGVLEALFAAAGMTAGKVGQLLTGGGVMNLPEGWLKLITAANELGLPGLMPHQVSRSPFLRRNAAHAAGLRSKISDYRDSQINAATDTVKELYDPKLAASGHYDTADPAIKAVDESWKNYKNDLLLSIKSPGVSFKEAQEGITGAIDEYREVTDVGVKKLYEVAKEKGPIDIDLGKVQDFATKLRDGEYTEGQLYGTFQGQKAKEKGIVKQTADGFTVENKVVPSGAKQQYSKQFDVLKALGDVNTLTPELQSIVFDLVGDFGNDSIAKMSQKLTFGAKGTDLSPIEAVNSIRARLYPLTLPDKLGNVRSDAAQAGKLYALLNDALENSSNPQANEAFKFASQKARERFETLEQAKLAQFYRAENGQLSTDPVSMARTVLSGTGRNPSNLSAMHSIMTEPEWRKVQDSVITDIMRDPKTMLTKARKLMEFPEENGLLYKGRDKEISDIIKVGEQLERWDQTGLADLVKNQKRNFNFIEGLVARGDQSAIPPMIKNMLDQGYSKTEANEAVRAGILDYIVKSATTKEPGNREFITDKLTQVLAQADKAQLQLFLKPDDWKTLDTVRQYLQAVEKGKFDSGMNLESAGTLAKIKEGSISAIRAMVLDAPWTGYLLTSKAGQRFIMGGGLNEGGLEKLPTVLATVFGAYEQSDLLDSYRRASTQTMDAVKRFGGMAVDKAKEKVTNALD